MSLNSEIAQLILEKGRAQAQGIAGSGQAWGSALSQIGQNVGQAIQQANDPNRQIAALHLAAAQRDAAGQAAMAKLMTPQPQAGPQMPNAAPMAPMDNHFLKKEGDVSVWDAEGLSKAMAAQGLGDLTPKVIADIGGLNAAHRQEAQARQQFGTAQANVMAKGAGTALSILRDHPTADPSLVVGFVGDQMAANGTFPPDKIEAVKQQLLSDPTQLQLRLEALAKGGTQAPIELKDKSKLLNPNDLSGPPLADNSDPLEGSYTINGQRFKRDGTPIGTVQPAQTPPKSLEAKEGFVIKGTNNVPNFNPADGSWSFDGKPVASDQVERAAAPKDPMAVALGQVALENARQNLTDKQRRQNNVTAIADGMQRGTIPPDPEGLQRNGLYGDVVAEMQNRGVNFSTLRQQYLAQKALIHTENNNQSVRLDGAIRSGLAMYDKVDELSKQWDSMGLGPLSRANLAAATNGLKGKAAADLAIQLTGQIAQITSDVATVEQNGMTPTNEARQVAEKSLQNWWGNGTIQKMTAQGRANMAIRDMARKESQPLVPGAPVTAATPAAVTAPAIPANVATALKGASVGKHTLSDGSIWVVGSDGSVSKGS